MPKVISCGIAPIRKNGNDIEILLCVPIEERYFSPNDAFYGLGFLKGQVEDHETNLEAAKREFGEESGNLEIELYDEETYFTQNNPKKKIHIWPAKVLQTKFNEEKICEEGIVHDHDEENALIKFYSISDLPPIFRNQQKILDELLEFIENHKENI